MQSENNLQLMERKIFCVMPVFLGTYANSATNREHKFTRAVKSFLTNTYKNKLLIIVSDGCDKARDVYNKEFAECKEIMFMMLKKQPQWSGSVRQAGINLANKIGKPNDVICYLDSDDMLIETHIENIHNGFNRNPLIHWVYFNDYLRKNKDTVDLRQVALMPCMIGTSAIAHLNKPEYNWNDCNGYGHDWKFIEKLISSKQEYSKIYGAGYLCCHVPNYYES